MILSNNLKDSIKFKASEAIKKLSEYNLYILERIGYQPQLFLLKQIEKWEETDFLNNFDILIEIASNLLNPSFESHSLKDHKTVVSQFGALRVTDNL